VRGRGSTKGKLDTTVLGVALGVPPEQVSTGPFGQFQNCGDDEDSLTKLVMQLLQRNPDAAPREEAVRIQVNVFRNSVSSLLGDKGHRCTPSSSEDEETNIAKLFEEVKLMVMELPDRVRSASKRGGVRKLRHFHPGMIEDMLHHPLFRETRQGEALACLFLISMIRDDFPWLHEVGLELYRTMRLGNMDAVQEARDNFSVLST